MRRLGGWLFGALVAVAVTGPAAAQQRPFLSPSLMCPIPPRLDVVTVSTPIQCLLIQRNFQQVLYVATVTRLRYDMLGTRPNGVIRWNVWGTGDASGDYSGDTTLVGGANRAITLQPTTVQLPQFNVAKHITGMTLSQGRLR